MNRYNVVCRLRWPALLLLTGVIALLNQMGLLSWGRAWPLYLILLGVLALAERAAVATQPQPPVPTGVPGPNFASNFAGGYPAGYPVQPGGFPSSPAQPAYQPVSTGSVFTGTSPEPGSVDSASQPRKVWDEEGR